MLYNIRCIASRHIYIYSILLQLESFHPQERKYFADVHPTQLMQKLEQESIKNHFQTTIAGAFYK